MENHYVYDPYQANDIRGADKENLGTNRVRKNHARERLTNQQMKSRREAGLVELPSISDKHNGALDAIQEEGIG